MRGVIRAPAGEAYKFVTFPSGVQTWTKDEAVSFQLAMSPANDAVVTETTALADLDIFGTGWIYDTTGVPSSNIDDGSVGFGGNSDLTFVMSKTAPTGGTAPTVALWQQLDGKTFRVVKDANNYIQGRVTGPLDSGNEETDGFYLVMQGQQFTKVGTIEDGDSVTFQLDKTTSTTTYPWSFSATSLPAGITIGANNGLISGTPTAKEANIVSITATHSSGATVTKTFAALVQELIAATETDWDSLGTGWAWDAAWSGAPADGQLGELLLSPGFGISKTPPSGAVTPTVAILQTLANQIFRIKKDGSNYLQFAFPSLANTVINDLADVISIYSSSAVKTTEGALGDGDSVTFHIATEAGFDIPIGVRNATFSINALTGDPIASVDFKPMFFGGSGTITYTGSALPSGLSISDGVVSGTPSSEGSSSFGVTATDENSNTALITVSVTVGAGSVALSQETEAPIWATGGDLTVTDAPAQKLATPVITSAVYATKGNLTAVGLVFNTVPNAVNYRIAFLKDGTWELQSVTPTSTPVSFNTTSFENVTQVRIRADSAAGSNYLDSDWSAGVDFVDQTTPATISYDKSNVEPGSSVTATITPSAGINAYQWRAEFSGEGEAVLQPSIYPGADTNTFAVPSNFTASPIWMLWRRNGLWEGGSSNSVTVGAAVPIALSQETEVPIFSGGGDLTIEADTITSGVFEIDLGALDYSWSADRAAWVDSTGFGGDALPADWFEGSTTASQRRLYVTLIRANGNVNLRFGDTGGNTAGPQLKSALESAMKLQFEAGGARVTITGGTGSDVSEPYEWNPTDALETSQAIAWYGAQSNVNDSTAGVLRLAYDADFVNDTEIPIALSQESTAAIWTTGGDLSIIGAAQTEFPLSQESVAAIWSTGGNIDVENRAPQLTAQTGSATGEVDIAWTDAWPEAEGYDYRYRLNGSSAWIGGNSEGWNWDGDNDTNSGSRTITGLTASTLYDFQVRNYGPDSERHESAIISATAQQVLEIALSQETEAPIFSGGGDLSVDNVAPLSVTASASTFAPILDEVPTLSVTAEGGSGTYTYQWEFAQDGTDYLDWTDTGGQTNTINPDPGAVTTYWFRCKVSDGISEVYSSVLAIVWMAAVIELSQETDAALWTTGGDLTVAGATPVPLSQETSAPIWTTGGDLSVTAPPPIPLSQESEAPIFAGGGDLTVIGSLGAPANFVVTPHANSVGLAYSAANENNTSVEKYQYRTKQVAAYSSTPTLPKDSGGVGSLAWDWRTEGYILFQGEDFRITHDDGATWTNMNITKPVGSAGWGGLSIKKNGNFMFGGGVGTGSTRRGVYEYDRDTGTFGAEIPPPASVTFGGFAVCPVTDRLWACTVNTTGSNNGLWYLDPGDTAFTKHENSEFPSSANDMAAVGCDALGNVYVYENNDNDTLFFDVANSTWHTLDGIPNLTTNRVRAGCVNAEGLFIPMKYDTGGHGEMWGAWTDIPGGAAALSHTIPGLTHETLYGIQVRAVNDTDGIEGAVSLGYADTVELTVALSQESEAPVFATGGDLTVTLKLEVPLSQESQARRFSGGGGLTVGTQEYFVSRASSPVLRKSANGTSWSNVTLPSGVTLLRGVDGDPNGDIWLAAYAGTVNTFDLYKKASGSGSFVKHDTITVQNFSGMAVDHDGMLLILVDKDQQSANEIHKYNPETKMMDTSGVITIEERMEIPSDNPVTLTTDAFAEGIAVDAAGIIYVVQRGTDSVSYTDPVYRNKLYKFNEARDTATEVLFVEYADRYAAGLAVNSDNEPVILFTSVDSSTSSLLEKLVDGDSSLTNAGTISSNALNLNGLAFILPPPFLPALQGLTDDMGDALSDSEGNTI